MREHLSIPTAPGCGPSTSTKSGETFGLNLRFLLIVCVFVGNAIEPLIMRMPEMKAIFLWIFTFHMPLFVFITGYFARSNLNGAAGIRILKQIALQYIIFQTIYSLLDYLVFRVPGINHSFFIPYLLLWFLVGHLFWRLMMKMFTRFSISHPLLISIVLGFLVGFLPLQGAWLGISRSVVYLPFFVIGYTFSYERFRAWLTPFVRYVGVAISMALLVVLYVMSEPINPIWFMNHMTFHELGWTQSGWLALFNRTVIYLTQIVASAAFLAWVPIRETHLTNLGKRTLYVFLLHGLIIRFVMLTGVYTHITSGWSAALLITASIASAVLLAKPQVTAWLHPIIEPKWDAIAGWIRHKLFRAKIKHS